MSDRRRAADSAGRRLLSLIMTPSLHAVLEAIEQDLRSRRLVAPFIGIACREDGYFVVVQSAREKTPAIRALIDSLATEGASHAALVDGLRRSGDI